VKVLDSSAIIAFWRNEPGADQALNAFDGGLVSLVNLAEVLARIARDGVRPADAKGQIDRFGLTNGAPDFADALDVGRMPLNLGLSLGDKFCIALSRRFGVPLVTADRVFADAHLNIPVELIR
jgi:ribonuclease VapC